jgi:hypothetical protein
MLIKLPDKTVLPALFTVVATRKKPGLANRLNKNINNKPKNGIIKFDAANL